MRHLMANHSERNKYLSVSDFSCAYFVKQMHIDEYVVYFFVGPSLAFLQYIKFFFKEFEEKRFVISLLYEQEKEKGKNG